MCTAAVAAVLVLEHEEHTLYRELSSCELELIDPLNQCPYCDGEGKLYGKICKHCDGRGKL